MEEVLSGRGGGGGQRGSRLEGASWALVGAARTGWGPGEPCPSASRCREEAEWSFRTASWASLSLPSLNPMELGTGESQPRWCQLPSIGSPQNLGTAVHHTQGRARRGSEGFRVRLLWTGYHQSHVLGQNLPSLRASVSPSIKRKVPSLVFPSLNSTFILILQKGKLRHRKVEDAIKFHDPP